MKYLPTIAGILLGLLFLMASVPYFLNLIPEQAGPAPDSPMADFMGALISTGYLHFVKALELLGGLLVLVPRTRNLGLLVLGPIIVNIVACHAFLMKGEGLFHPMLIGICVLPLYLLWVGRKQWAGLLGTPR